VHRSASAHPFRPPRFFIPGLDQYIDRKTLSFLTFDEVWIPTRDTLEREVVESHVKRFILEVLGDDVDVTLKPLGRLIDANRKTTQQFVKDASDGPGDRRRGQPQICA
jgi:hypothetical protein